IWSKHSIDSESEQIKMITVLAATGFTGQLICQELLRLGVEFQIAGRSAEKLQALAVMLGRPNISRQVADVLRLETCQSIFANTQVLINCAGPFTDMGMGIARAAAEHGVHYLDTTGEQYFIKQVFDQLHEIAQQHGSVLIPACAFEHAVGDAGAALAAHGLGECDEINIYYAMDNVGMTRGTKKSLLRALANPFYFYRNGQYVAMAAAGEQNLIEFPKIGQRSVVSFGGGEICTIPRHTRTQRVSTFMSLGTAPVWLFKIGLTLTAVAAKTPLSKIMFRQIESQSVGPNEAERKHALFTIICEAKAGTESQRVIITGTDPYGVTAVICAETAYRLLTADKDINGVTSVAAVFGAEMIQRVTETVNVRWQLA
ncbi:MAG: saccharopine dehydrogenase NADP-binding domain-containing protein, partial [Acidobacteriota bacterium]